MVCFADDKGKDPGLVKRVQQKQSIASKLGAGVFCACSSNIAGVYYLFSCPKNWGVCWVDYARFVACCSPEV